MELKNKAQEALALRTKYNEAYQNNQTAEAIKLEREYLALRSEIINAVDMGIAKQKSIPIRKIKEEVEKMPKRPKRETGIRTLDYALVTARQATLGQVGGFSLGNYIQIAGGRGTGKTALMMKIMTNLSRYERVSWFDFEMGKKRVVAKLSDFPHDEDNLLYYSASRELSAVVGEIKLLQASGVNHFVIDSTMKITVAGADKYDKFSLISQQLSELTSLLNVNIYIINQISQSAEREGFFQLKGGNDAEYDADYIFFISKLLLKKNGMPVKDEHGAVQYDEERRKLNCTKNREDDRTFSLVLEKAEILGSIPLVVEYEE